MAVAFDAASSASGGPVTALSFTHTPVGTPTGVGFGLSIYPQVGTPTVTYGGASATLVVTKDIPAAYEKAQIYGLANPSSGAQTVILNPNGGLAYFGGGAITVTGGDTTTVFSNSASAQGTSATPSVAVTSATGELAMSSCVADGSPPTYTAGSGQTNRWTFTSASLRGATDTEAGASSVTMDGTLNESDGWAMVAASFKAAAASSAIKTINGLALASVKTVNGLAIASVKTVNGLA